jgi:hypothetical protein
MHRERRLTSQVSIFDAILPPSIAKFREFRRVILEGKSDSLRDSGVGLRPASLAHALVMPTPSEAKFRNVLLKEE